MRKVFIAMVRQPWSSLKVTDPLTCVEHPVSLGNQSSIGFAPIFACLADAESEYPDREILELEEAQRNESACAN